MNAISDGTGAPGAPFGTTYRTGAAVDEPTPRTRRFVRRQVSEMIERRSSPELQRQLALTLQARWADRRGRRLDVLTGDHGHELLLVGGELLVTTVTWADAEARSYLEGRGLHRAALGCDDLDERVVRLVAEDGVPAQSLDDTVSELRSRGHAASLTHVAPLAPVIKGLGGPAAGPSLGAFTDYPAHGADTGTPARVAIIDTGIDAAVRTDGWLAGVVRREHDDPTSHGNDANIDPLDSDPRDDFLDFSAGHGTFVAGVVAQVAPGAEISVYRALRSGGIGSELEVACALIRAVKDGAQVVNLSLGCQTRSDQPSLALAAALDEIAVIEADRGDEVVIIAAAGNFGDTTPTWPAAFERVVAVGALAPDMNPASWSSRGPWVDCSTISEGILSTFVEGSESTEFTADPDTFGPNAFARWSGTSFAAPQIAGAVARTMQQHGLTARQAMDRLLTAGQPLPDFGRAFSILPGLS